MNPSRNILATFGINGSLLKREVQAQASYTEYYLFNSAANLKAYSNNGLDFAYYGYNAANTRAYKFSMLNQNQWFNGQPFPLHFSFGQVFLRSAKSKQACIPLSLSANSLCFVSFIFSGRRKKERNEGKNFYYHMNHLGSTAFVTDQNQNITQGFLYAPFGEITTEYSPLWQNGTLPKYSFNAKELDEETGMYYYEARYYKPPVFTSRDPMFEKYFWMTPYGYCANNPVKYVDPNGKWPTKKVSGGKVSRNFSNTKKTHPISKEKRNHYGVDFAVPTNTEVHAAASGIVIYTGYQYNKQSKTGYGYYIDIQHDNGYITRYAHLSTIEVKKDDEVTDGFIIGYSGATGGVTGPHLHFEIMKDGEYIDPLTVNDLQKRINFENGCPIQLDEVKVIDIAPVFEFSDPLINMNEKYIEDALKRMIEDIKPIDINLNNLQNDEYTKVKK